MKRRLITFALAALTIGLLGSCSKINERIDGLDERIYDLENKEIASIENQIAAINASIADLGAIRQDILDLQVAVGAKGEDIAELKAADEALGKRIDELQTYVDTELAKYATTEWANATFATLEKLNETSTALSALEEKVDKLGETFDGKLSDLKTELTNSINTAVSNLETRISTLEARVSALEQMIQTVTIVPAYNDGSVESMDGSLYLDIIVTPAEAVAALGKDSLKVLVNEVTKVTKAVSVNTVAVTNFKKDAAKGTITARADISSVLPAETGKGLTVAVNVKNGISDYITGFYPVILSSNATVKDESTATKVTIKADEDFPGPVVGNIVVADGFKETKQTTIEVGGIGTVTFDQDATSKIKSNAEQAGATKVSFQVEDVTTATQIPNADVVLEVTMKTVDETGTEVFSEAVADGIVTIQIPMDEKVAYVNSVALVNEAGELIEGGVVPGSESFVNGILTFKVEHFSMYAIDYVTKTDFVAVTGVSIEPVSVTLQVDDTLKLVATIVPEDATNKNVTWSSSNESVATVDNDGKVTAVAAGTATITATTVDGSKTASCEVTVTVPVTGVSLNVNTLSLNAGGSHTLIATITPEDATNKNVTWSSSNESVATVDNDGKVTAVAAGTATITATTVDSSKTATCEVTVTVPVTGVSLNVNTLSLNVYDSHTLIATITPEDANNKNVTWSSSNESVATVDNDGKVTAVAAGTATITATTVDGSKTATCTVTVIPFVDLGVKTATGKPLYWAECNLGASNPEDPGNYYMWGATALMYSAVDYTKKAGAFTFVTENPYGDNYKNTWNASKGFVWNNTPFTDGVYNNSDNKKVFTKYTTIDTYAKSGTPDNMTTLEDKDDAATAKNSSWRMPTIDDFKSLVANCVLVWTSDYNSTSKAGYIVYKAKNEADKGKANTNGTWKMWDAANSKYITNTGSEPTGYSTSDIHIFLPAAGIGYQTNLNNYNIGSVYWSSSLATSDDQAFALTIMSGGISINGGQRQYGYTIRPVTE